MWAHPIDQLLVDYFQDTYNFELENVLQGAAIFKRTNRSRVRQRVVAKFDDYGSQEWKIEERCLIETWGCEHIVRLLAIMDDEEHQGPEFVEPRRRRRRPVPIISWLLQKVNYERYRMRQQFFVMEYLPLGSVKQLEQRATTLESQGYTECYVSQDLLWNFFLCLARACIGLAYPPNLAGQVAPETWRERVPSGRRPSAWAHRDLHENNVLFGDIQHGRGNSRNRCHEHIPVCKSLASGDRSSNEYTKLMQSIALRRSADYLLYIFSDDDRIRIPIVYPPGTAQFETWVGQDFLDCERLSLDFRGLVARCLARNEADRPLPGQVVQQCERFLPARPDWRALNLEVDFFFNRAVANDGDLADRDYRAPSRVSQVATRGYHLRPRLGRRDDEDDEDEDEDEDEDHGDMDDGDDDVEGDGESDGSSGGYTDEYEI
ncbi:hypothetical protein GGS20DRAFT_550054 [Poronia punctata]|nr:hypothetical protein GGS20DRAFT_550054 [Poronia punctata]